MIKFQASNVSHGMHVCLDIETVIQTSNNIIIIIIIVIISSIVCSLALSNLVDDGDDAVWYGDKQFVVWLPSTSITKNDELI